MVDAAIEQLAGMSGPGVGTARRDLLVDLFARATEPEQGLLFRIFSGELRQGALDGVMVEAIAKGSGVPIADVRRAHMMAGDLGQAARAALTGGAAAVAAVALVPGRAVQPMLASPADDVAAAVAATGPASVEWKLDGARIQAHRHDGRVALYTRNLNEITARLGAVADLVAGLPGGDLVLDGEALGVDDDGAPRRFQDSMGDFGADAPTGRGGGLSAYFFDVLHAGSEAVVDEPLSVRREILATIVPAESRLPSIITADADEAARSSTVRSRRGTRASWSKLSTRATTPAAVGAPGARSSRCTRSISWCSPWSGVTAGVQAGCPTSTSAHRANPASS